MEVTKRRQTVLKLGREKTSVPHENVGLAGPGALCTPSCLLPPALLEAPLSITPASPGPGTVNATESPVTLEPRGKCPSFSCLKSGAAHVT